MPNAVLVGMVAETPVHIGVGRAAAAIDLPVAREKTTGFPHAPGSGVKGAWRVWAGADVDGADPEIVALFGKGGDAATDIGAGTLLFGEARLALLPVRATSDSFKLVTCPTIIRRLLQDRARAELPEIDATPSVEDGLYVGQEITSGPNTGKLGLEEREFDYAGNTSCEIRSLFQTLIGDQFFDSATLERKLVVLSDGDFAWFATFGLPVAMRNALDKAKIVRPGALWAEETLATDTVMWSVLSEREPGAIARLRCEMTERTYLQLGGNETIGQGWFSIRIISEGA